MKKILIISMLVLLVAGFAQAKEYEIKKTAGEYSVEITIDRNPPVVGNNNVKIGIKDAAGGTVADAKVIVEYSMPVMPGMPPMNYKAEGELKDNLYHAVMKLNMSGSWNVSLRITRAGKTTTTRLTVDAK
ncbi:MAG: FixH family protein [Smithellaceae bacterium]|nr:FixH family protein [Smithellaceae bacterium]